ncbi:MAG: anthranilate synthase component I [Streptosporangiales bacterium]|nr:anthranilate synthase component I [Streptosporangiales bacterium]
MTIEYTTPGGVAVARHDTDVAPEDLDALVAEVGRRRGGVLSSGMEYPGRYSRWHLAYVNPALEVTAHGRRLAVRALNERGRVLLPVVVDAVLAVGEPTGPASADGVEVYISPGDGVFPEEERSRQPTVFSALRRIAALFANDRDEHLGLYGAFGYDLAFQFEPIRLCHPREDGQRDMVLQLPDQILVVDRKRETCRLHSYEFTVSGVSTEGLPRGSERSDPFPPRPASRSAEALPLPPERGSYARIVGTAREKFARGDLFEVVPSQTFHAPCDEPALFFERLRHTNPAPYEFFFNLGEGEYLVGASPEMFVRVTGDRVETCPISGTIRRGADPLEDAERIQELLNSAKDEAELTMCTDVDRNDKSRVCVPGTVRVIGRRQIELYSRLIHTVDHVEGRLRPGFDALDAFLTHMWAVTVTGAPKTWAMQFIEEHEARPRRWYGGAVGVIGFDGSLNTGLTLRTAHIQNNIAAVRVGATLLHDSDPDAEERETELKARALLESLAATRMAEPPEEEVTAVPAADRLPAGAGMRVLLVDHQDSFVNTLGDYFRRHGAEVTTLRAGFPEVIIDEIAPDLVVLSPGPGRPSDFGCARLLDALVVRELPIFGVCLGLQAMVEHAGGELSLLAEPVHGKPSTVTVLGGDLLAGLPPTFTAARYHSLYAERDAVRSGFEVTAASEDGVVMAIENARAAHWAVQFHPESILTARCGAGPRIVDNVLRLARDARERRGALAQLR